MNARFSCYFSFHCFSRSFAVIFFLKKPKHSLIKKVAQHAILGYLIRAAPFLLFFCLGGFALCLVVASWGFVLGGWLLPFLFENRDSAVEWRRVLYLSEREGYK